MNRAFIIGVILLIVGVLWSIVTSSIGTIEWLLLLVGVILGIVAGLIQGWAIARKEQGKIGSGKRMLYIVGTIIILIALKVALNIMIPSYLATSQVGIWLSIIFAIGGLFIGRALYPVPRKSISRR